MRIEPTAGVEANSLAPAPKGSSNCQLFRYRVLMFQLYCFGLKSYIWASAAKAQAGFIGRRLTYIQAHDLLVLYLYPEKMKHLFVSIHTLKKGNRNRPEPWAKRS